MAHRILFATNFTPVSRRALDYAVAFAQKARAELVGVYVLKLPLPVYSLAPPPASYRKELEQAGEQRLAEFFQPAEVDGMEMETRLCFGDPAQELGKLARKEKADLLVVAKHSRSTLEKFFVASTTEKTLRESPAPVLVVPDTGLFTLRWSPITCAVDFSDASRKALKFAVELARQCNCGLAVIHCLEMGSALGALGGKARSALQSLPRQVQARLDELIAGVGAPPGTQAIVAEGKPAEAIVSETARLGSDLLIVGRRGSGRVEGPNVGTTAAAVVREIHCPLIVVPEMRRR